MAMVCCRRLVASLGSQVDGPLERACRGVVASLGPQSGVRGAINHPHEGLLASLGTQVASSGNPCSEIAKAKRRDPAACFGNASCQADKYSGDAVASSGNPCSQTAKADRREHVACFEHSQADLFSRGAVASSGSVHVGSPRLRWSRSVVTDGCRATMLPCGYAGDLILGFCPSSGVTTVILARGYPGYPIGKVGPSLGVTARGFTSGNGLEFWNESSGGIGGPIGEGTTPRYVTSCLWGPGTQRKFSDRVSPPLGWRPQAGSHGSAPTGSLRPSVRPEGARKPRARTNFPPDFQPEKVTTHPPVLSLGLPTSAL